MDQVESTESRPGPPDDEGRQTSVFRGLGPSGFARLRLTRAAVVDLIDLPPAQAAQKLEAGMHRPSARPGPVTVAFMNMRNYVVSRRYPESESAFASMDQVYPDGVGLQVARRLLGLCSYPRVSGTDTIPLLMQRLRPGTRVFLLGGTTDLSIAAGVGFSRLFPSLILAGVHHGYFSAAQDDGVVAAIVAARPDVLLIGMGSPLQECWLARHRDHLPARLAICVGGLFHYWAEDLRRAPQKLRDVGLEWLWILAQQPGKWRVYSIDAARFGVALLRLKRSAT
jgi:N-acetylglucosaminyldiphosphoundecaprenol N-acetyl-beta-D-mannosaminyltransferase